MSEAYQRFSKKRIPGFTLEYDHADDTLRISWSGSQVFMTREEAEALLHFLLDVGIMDDTTKENDFSYLEGTDAAWNV
jgi:hypothetical protein